MSMEIACQCEHVPGIGPHSHLYQQTPVWTELPDGRRSGRMDITLDEYDVRPWVDWRAVARELAAA